MLFRKSSVWQSLCHIDLPCHTERSEVSTNLKCEFALLRRALNSVDFSLSAKAQNDKHLFVILTCLVIAPYLVILSEAKYP